MIQHSSSKHGETAKADPRKDPDDFSLVDKSALRSYEGPLQFDVESGLPLNPHDQVRVSGRGVLYKWGPNIAADVLVTRDNLDTGIREMLAIKRKTGEWAIPGGMEDSGETPEQTAFRELEEETGIKLSAASGEYHCLAYQGYVKDPRNTDNAWIETTLFHVHLSFIDSKVLNPTALDDAREVCWLPLIEDNIDALYASHGEMVRLALNRFEAVRGRCGGCSTE